MKMGGNNYFYTRSIQKTIPVMKNSLNPLLAVMFLLVSCSGGETDLARSGLKGKVSSITERQFKAVHKDGNWVAGNPVYLGYQVRNYNREGFYLESIAVAGSGDTLGFTRCRRENGEMVEESFHSVVEKRSTRTLFERVSGEQVNFEVWEGEQLLYEGASYNDSKGRIVRQVGVVNDLEVVNYSVYEKNLLVELYQEDLAGNRTMTQHYEYTAFDDQGNWTSRLVYVGEEKITPEVVATREYTYY